MYADKVDPEQDNGMYGKGTAMKRYTAMLDILDANEGAVDRNVAWEALKAAAQDPNPEDITSNTQWSIMFDNTNLTAEFTLRRRWGESFSFGINDWEKIQFKDWNTDKILVCRVDAIGS